MCLFVLIFEPINTFVMYRTLYHTAFKQFLAVKNIVMVLRADNNMQETFYLLKSPKNATRLLESIEEYKSGKDQERTLIEI